MTTGDFLCPRCGECMSEEVVTFDSYDPGSEYGHHQREVVSRFCPACTYEYEYEEENE